MQAKDLHAWPEQWDKDLSNGWFICIMVWNISSFHKLEYHESTRSDLEEPTTGGTGEPETPRDIHKKNKQIEDFQASYITASLLLEQIGIHNFWEVSNIINSHSASGTEIVVGQQQYFPRPFSNGNGEHRRKTEHWYIF